MKSIEANIKYVVLFLIAFLLLLTVFNLIGRCEEKTDVPGMDRADSLLVADSIKTSILRSRIDSLENEIALRNDRISELKAKSQQKIVEWKVITSETTNDTILLADTIIMEQGETIDLLSKNLADCDSASSIKDTIIQNKSLVVMDLYDQLQYTNDELVLCEKKRQSWWNRNKLWIGLGVGVIVGGGGVLLIRQ